MINAGPQFGFGLYVHWPYCARICPYCDFNVYAAKTRETGPLLNAMVQGIRAQRERLPEHPRLNTIFFGGGTPSLMQPDQLSAILEAAQNSFGLDVDAEVTLEANPNDVLHADLKGWQQAGINRLSIGIQSLNDDALTFLGRDHSSEDALRSIEAALLHFPSVSIDLIYARPQQSLSAWERELRNALNLGAHHLSLYELTIEARTAFGKAAERVELVPMPDDSQADLYDLTQEVTRAAGYPAYEVSNHAVSERHQSQHNMIYWQSGDWIGIGPGAHGRVTLQDKRIATEAARRPAEYIQATAPSEDCLSGLDVARETLAMGLRPATGIRMDRLSGLDETALKDLQANGLIAITDGYLHTTPDGRILTDAIAAKLSP